jgi:hypothetical protein
LTARRGLSAEIRLHRARLANRILAYFAGRFAHLAGPRPHLPGTVPLQKSLEGSASRLALSTTFCEGMSRTNKLARTLREMLAKLVRRDGERLDDAERVDEWKEEASSGKCTILQEVFLVPPWR